MNAGGGSGSSVRPIRMMRSSWRGLRCLDQLPTVHLPDPPATPASAIDDSSPLDRVAANPVRATPSRSIFSQQGIALARGQKQWTVAGIAQLQSYAQPIEDCSIDDLWKGRLNSELLLMASINTQLKSLDAKLDELADPRMKLLQTLKGVGPRTAEAVVLYIDRSQTLQERRGVSQLRRPGSQTTAKR